MNDVPRVLTAGVVAAAMVATLVACAGPAEPAGPAALNIGVEPAHIEHTPSPLQTGAILNDLGWTPVYESLIVWDTDTAAFGPWLAEEFVLSEDRQTLTLTLRDDVDFSDGVHFDAAAVEEYFAISLAYAEWPALADFQSYETEVAATGEYELEFTTSRPMDYEFLDLLSILAIASPEAMKDPDSLAQEPVGTGPYLLDEWVADVSMSFVRNPDYWNPEEFPFDTVTITAFEDRVAAFNALKSGEINAANLEPAMTAEAEREGFAIHAGGGNFVLLVLRDLRGELVPALADVRVRQAMNLAFDRAGIVESLEFGYGRVSSQVATVGQGHYVEGGDERYGFDVERARELMAEAGYADGFDIVIPAAPGAEALPPQYQPVVEASLAEIGIRVTWKQFADLNAAFGEFGNYPVELVRPAYSNIPQALFLFPGMEDDPTYIELKGIADSGTTAESEQALADLGEYMLDEAWFVPFSHPANVWVTDPEIDITLGTLNGRVQLRLVDLAD